MSPDALNYVREVLGLIVERAVEARETSKRTKRKKTSDSDFLTKAERWHTTKWCLP